MILQKALSNTESEIRCLNIIKNRKDKKFGQACDKLLAKRTPTGEIAGEFCCNRCDAIHLVINDTISLINSK